MRLKVFWEGKGEGKEKEKKKEVLEKPPCGTVWRNDLADQLGWRDSVCVLAICT